MRSKVSKLVETCRQVERWLKGLKRQKFFCGFANVRSKNITRTRTVFLWKILHNVRKCEDYWLQIPDFECHRCFICGVEDSMAHILAECKAPGQQEIWNLAREVWQTKHFFWPKVDNLGVIMVWHD
jgi:hypothetical protein